MARAKLASSEPSSISLPVGGYVLAGGKSSRMGQSKALLELEGKPLVLHAVTKLRRLCTAVNILGSDAELAAYGALVEDVHPDCGPMGGMEAALLHTRFDWNLFVPVDVPFVPAAYLGGMVRQVLDDDGPPGVVMASVDGVRQPTLAVVHRAVCPFLTEALERGQFKLTPVLQEASRAVSGREGLYLAQGGNEWWFRNLNTPEDFAEAKRHADALDTE